MNHRSKYSTSSSKHKLLFDDGTTQTGIVEHGTPKLVRYRLYYSIAQSEPGNPRVRKVERKRGEFLNFSFYVSLMAQRTTKHPNSNTSFLTSRIHTYTVSDTYLFDFSAVMKRTAQSVDNDGTELPLKKRTSSLFSIATICEDDNDTPNALGNASNASSSSSSIGLDLMATRQKEPIDQTFVQSPAQRSLPSVTPQSLSCAEDSSCTDGEDDSSISSGCVLKPPLHAALSTTDAAPQIPLPKEAVLKKEVVLCSSSSNNNTNLPSDQGDFRTGLVFEAGSDHYDRHSRLHKERPLRVTSIMDALKKAENDAFDRCCVLGEDDDKAEASDKSSGGSSSAAPITTTTTAAMTPTNSATNFLEDEDYLRVHRPGYMKRYVDLLAVPFHYLLIFKCFVLVLLSNC